jgi:hypothetical protein
LASGREFFFAPRQGSIERTGMNGNSKLTADRLLHGFLPLHILSSTPTLDEIEDLLGAFVIAPRPSGTWQQSRNPCLLEGLIGDIEGLSTDTESLGHIGDRPPLDPMAPQHFVLDLHAVAGVEEFVFACEGFVAHTLWTGMKSTGGPQSRRLWIVWSSSRHECQ